MSEKKIPNRNKEISERKPNKNQEMLKDFYKYFSVNPNKHL